MDTAELRRQCVTTCDMCSGSNTLALRKNLRRVVVLRVEGAGQLSCCTAVARIEGAWMCAFSDRDACLLVIRRSEVRRCCDLCSL